MENIRKVINTCVDIVISSGIVSNTLKSYIDPQSVPRLYAAINNGPNNLNRNFMQFLSESGIRGSSRSFVSNFSL